MTKFDIISYGTGNVKKKSNETTFPLKLLHESYMVGDTLKTNLYKGNTAVAWKPGVFGFSCLSRAHKGNIPGKF